MSKAEVLHDAEINALSDNQIVTKVVGKEMQKKHFGARVKAFGATGVVTAIILMAAAFLGSGFLIPVAVYEKLTEVTDVYYADGVESQILVFQQALKAENLSTDEVAIPQNTVTRLKDNGVLVGYMNNGEFVEDNMGGKNLMLLYQDEVITANEFYQKVNSDAGLYAAFTSATYGRAAYYYDEVAKEVFRKIGTNRNNYSYDADFEEVTAKIMGEGSNIDINNVALVERENEEGEVEYSYEELGTDATSKLSASDLIGAVAAKNTADSTTKATLNSADALTVADTIASEQRSALLFVTFMENISKMKAGDGNDAKVNDVMNTLYRVEKSQVVDVKTGEVIEVEGSMMDAPSLYAILSDEKVDMAALSNYSSERILKTVENLTESKADSETLGGTVSSTATKLRGSIGRFVSDGSEGSSTEILSAVTPTVENSLINNSFSTTGGINGGVMLVDGAVSVGKMLAMASGGTAGDNSAIKSYAKINDNVLALEAEADRMNRSPFDVTSKNTFLGAIVYKFAVASRENGILKSLASLMGIGSKAAKSLMPASYADNEADSYLTNYGDCERLERIHAEGSATCTAIVTFDTSTLEGVFEDENFIKFVNENTELNNGNRVIRDDSVLADFIKYNNERITPIGVTDGGILTSLSSGNSKIPFVSNILSMVKSFLGASESDLRLASGEAFVNSVSNADWETYKYAQRYVSLARATAALRQYDGEATAYNNMQFFEGSENPVVAFLNRYYSIASN